MVDYTVLKTLAIRSCVKTNKFSNFTVNFDKLTKLVDEIGLEPVKNGTISQKISPNDMFIISTYLRDKKLKWINDSKEYTILTFVPKDAIDDNCRYLMDIIESNEVDNPDNDKTNAMAELIADYPCYFVLVVSYKSNEPRRFNQLSYEVKCRSNSVVIKNEGYGYTKPDNTENNSTEETTENESAEETE